MGESSKNRRRTRLLVVGVGAWLSVLVLCLFQYARVQELRGEVEAHVGTLTQADQVRLSVSSATRSELQSVPNSSGLEAVQDWLAECRRAAEPQLDEATVESRREACNALEDWLQRLDADQSPLDEADAKALSLAQIQVAEAFGGLIVEIRRQNGDISERLGDLWMVLSALGVALVGLSGTLGLSLVNYRRRNELLRKAKEAVEESELKLDLRVRQRTAELQVSNQRLEKEIAERKQLEMEVLEIERRERERIGADLHDGLAQQLAGISLLQKSLENKLSAREVPESEEARRIGDLVSDAIKQSRALARGLAAVGSMSRGLQPALESLAEDAEVLFGVPCEVRVTGNAGPLEIEQTNHLFRIAQEAVHNAAKHAGASRIVIELSEVHGQLELRIKDDGSGIPDATDRSEGIGLRLMKHRASLIDGILTIQKGPGGGTKVVCRFSKNPAISHAQPVRGTGR